MGIIASSIREPSKENRIYGEPLIASRYQSARNVEINASRLKAQFLFVMQGS
jgi:hypothetical protein